MSGGGLFIRSTYDGGKLSWWALVAGPSQLWGRQVVNSGAILLPSRCHRQEHTFDPIET